ncbi:MAG: hypothetical protein H0W73_04850 [Bacteroidetes bacterium]|nr:hypothetical protein [Bacteroidota bacterium]
MYNFQEGFMQTVASIATCLLFFNSSAQTKIVSSSFSSYNVSAESMCGINISNNAGEISVTIESKITNVQGTELIKVTSNPITLKNGVFNSLQLGLKVANINYQNTSVAEFVRIYHQLPSGKYNYCVSININDGVGDELCDDIESESSSFLTLINPIDKDTLEIYNPVLIWNHSETFNILQQGEFYRMIVTEIKKDQNAESAINVNNALFQQNFLSKHDVLYPFDAPKLQTGGRYAWQVQKVANGVITNKTEAWEFVFKSKTDVVPMVVEITPKLNVSPYIVVDDKICFLFKEEYSSTDQKLNAVILNAKGEEVKIKRESGKNVANSNIKQTGSNRYEVNLFGLGLKEGNYLLKIFNEKDQAFLLKFIIQ